MGPVPSSSGRRYRLPRPMGGTCDWFAATTWEASRRVEKYQKQARSDQYPIVCTSKRSPHDA